MANLFSWFAMCFGWESSNNVGNVNLPPPPPPKNTASMSVVEAVKGSHRYTIVRYSLSQRATGVGKFITSKTFSVGGHDWFIRCYPNGSRQSSARHISLFLQLGSHVAGGVKATLEFLLLDHLGKPAWKSKKISSVTMFEYKDHCLGFDRFVEKTKASGYLMDDCLTIICNVSVLQTRTAEVQVCPNIVVPPSNYHRNLGWILESGVGADVTFDVDGKIFPAHRCVLAAQSPVFRAELYGQMKESGMRCIKIEGMERVVFEALLHFVYNDTFSQEMDMLMAQHLLEAADRYGLERLKVICEKKVHESLNVGNVATTLVLAEQHQCLQLKAACLDFIINHAKAEDVMATDGYNHLMTCRPALDELVKKLISSQPKIQVTS